VQEGLYEAPHLNHFIYDSSETNFQLLSEKNTIARHREVCATLRTWRVLGVLYATKHSWLAMTEGCNMPHIHAEHELIYVRLSRHGQHKRKTFGSLFVWKQCIY